MKKLIVIVFILSFTRIASAGNREMFANWTPTSTYDYLQGQMTVTDNEICW